MRIKFFEKLFKPSQAIDSAKVKQQESVKANKTGIATVRDSFAKARSENYFSGKLLESGDLQKEQDYGRKQNQDDVLVEFQAGDTRSPYVLGGLWNSSDKPPETKSDSEDDKKKKKG
jgi:hypothetical protein